MPWWSHVIEREPGGSARAAGEEACPTLCGSLDEEHRALCKNKGRLEYRESPIRILKETSPGSLGGRLDYSSASCPFVARITLQKAAFRILVQTRGAGAVARAVTPGIDSCARDATGLLNSYVGSRAGTSGEREFKVEMEASVRLRQTYAVSRSGWR